jgi:hypothetical protein
MKKLILVFACVLMVCTSVNAQPFADIGSFNVQTFSGNYKDSLARKNRTDDYFLNFFLPKVFKNENALLIRLNAESLVSTIGGDSSYTRRISSVSLPIGFKFVSKSKKWETIIIGVPKIASDFRQELSFHDYQLGGIFLEHFVPRPGLKIKAGLYYNREAFGNFFVPLVSVDWKVNERWYFYGILPTNYRIEYNAAREKFYTGLNFKSLTRSFRLSGLDRHDYVRYDEIQLKLFADWFVVPKVLLFAEVGYTLGKNPWQYTYNTKTETSVNPVFTPMKSYPIFNFGIAYRIRTDLPVKATP